MLPRSVGRYQVHEAFARGGMASVHLGRLQGDAGFARIVAVKQLHPSVAEDASLVSTLLDEARLAARVRHPSVVATLDVVVDGADLFLVLEYVHGESLSRLARPPNPPPPLAIAAAVIASALHGLHAAHEARAEDGEPLGIVHRDVSPQNILVGIDGLGRVFDFGIAKARGRLQTTREGQVKGKLAYMAPEQIRLGAVTPRTDVFAAGIVLWETLTGERLFDGENEGHVMHQVLEHPIPAPSTRRADVTPALDAVVARALHRDPAQRFETAHAFALALEAAFVVAPPSTVGAWVRDAARDALATRAARIAAIENGAPAEARLRVTSSEDATRSDLDASPGATSALAPSRSTWPWVAAVGIALVGILALVAWNRDTPTPDAAARPLEAPAGSGPVQPSPLPPPSSTHGTAPSAVLPAKNEAIARPTASSRATGRDTLARPKAQATATSEATTATSAKSPFYRME